MAERKRCIGIVGCGVSGLAAIKSCLEEGLEPTCFEMKPDIGGLWYPTDDPRTETGPHMYDSLITNTSKAMMCFSDFPCPASYPPYLPHDLYLQYLHTYAAHFDLRKHIHFHTKVVSVHKHPDYLSNGRWIIVTEPVNRADQERQHREYDGVMLCQGFFRIPRSPKIPGAESFTGRIQHAAQYRRPESFRNKRVIVVGNASSAGDIAVDVASVAKEVYLSVGDGAFVVSRLDGGCTPLDFSLRRTLFNWLPSSFVRRALVRRANKWLNVECTGLKPKPTTSLERIQFIINDQLPFKILCGKVKVVGHVTSVKDGKVFLEDGTSLDAVDNIVFATGYKHDLHFIDSRIICTDQDEDKLELYKMVFPLSQHHDTLALIGCLRVQGPVPPILETQARLAAQVMAGCHKLPSQKAMKKDVDRLNEKLLKKYGRYNYAFQSLPMSDEIASELGVRPVWWHLLLQGDIQMAYAVSFGPAYPFHYRLMGPGAWSGARDAILHAYNETVFSMQHRTVDKVAIEKKSVKWSVSEVIHRYNLWVVHVFSIFVFCSSLALLLAWCFDMK